jgi:hypothetical protein
MRGYSDGTAKNGGRGSESPRDSATKKGGEWEAVGSEGILSPGRGWEVRGFLRVDEKICPGNPAGLSVASPADLCPEMARCIRRTSE